MNVSRMKVLHWAPRILGLLFAAFLSLFALDVFGVGYSFWETIGALFMHLIPVYILLIGVALGWRWQRIGALFFVGFAVAYIYMAWASFGIGTMLIVAGPAFLIGLLFLLDSFQLRRPPVTI